MISFRMQRSWSTSLLMENHLFILIAIVAINVNKCICITHTKVDSDKDRLLPYTASFYYGNVAQCPWLRKKPTLSISREITFDSVCFLTNRTRSERSVGSCPLRPGFCFKEFILHHKISRRFSISVLIEINCRSSGQMRILSWSNFYVNVACDKQQRLLVASGGTISHVNLSTFPETLSLIFQNIMDNADVPLEIIINGQHITPEHSEDVYDNPQLYDRTAITVGYHPWNLTSKKNPVTTFGGTIKELNIFRENWLESDQEYQYLELLSRGAPHPECTCPPLPSATISHDWEMCSNGRSRFTGEEIGGKYFWNMASLNDGIKDSSRHYGYIKNRPSGGLWIIPDRSAMITEIEIIAAKSSFRVSRYWYFKNAIFCGLGSNTREDELPERCTGRFETWQQHGTVWRITWKTSGQMLITKHLDIYFYEEEREKTLYEVEIRGRELDSDGQNGDFFCFPYNTINQTKDECGECKCRAGNQFQAGPDCKPYISYISPKSAPISGGTNLTIHGGLLEIPYMRYTTVRIGNFEICRDRTITRNDTQISCTLREGPPAMSGVEQRVQVTFHEYVHSPYTLRSDRTHVFKYLPIPNITSIAPKVAFLPVNTLITVKGKDFDVIYTEFIRIVIGGLHKINKTLPCDVMSSTIMTCNLTISLEGPVFYAFIECPFHGCEIFKHYLAFDLEQPPILTTTGAIELKRTGEVWKVLTGLVVVLLVVGTSIVVIVYLRRRGRSLVLAEHGHGHPISIEGHLEPSLLDNLEDALKNKVMGMRIAKDDLCIHEQIGKGNSGTVLRGSIVSGKTTRQVALKTLKDTRYAAENDLKEFLEEATMMKDLRHRNVLSLIGVVVDGWDLYVVLPYMPNGDLRTFVSKKDFDNLTFTGFALDVARGMQYLSVNKFVHRDLAARNCMVDAAERVYIGDFGLARDIFEKDYYRLDDQQRPLPYRWMAIECFMDEMFSTKSDVWAFGVLLWEIFAQGRKPYPNIKNANLLDYLSVGYRLTKPEKCTDFLFSIMQSCWLKSPMDRPDFSEIVSCLTQYMLGPEILKTNESSDEYMKPLNLPVTAQKPGDGGYLPMGKEHRAEISPEMSAVVPANMLTSRICKPEESKDDYLKPVKSLATGQVQVEGGYLPMGKEHGVEKSPEMSAVVPANMLTPRICKTEESKEDYLKPVKYLARGQDQVFLPIDPATSPALEYKETRKGIGNDGYQLYEEHDDTDSSKEAEDSDATCQAVIQSASSSYPTDDIHTARSRPRESGIWKSPTDGRSFNEEQQKDLLSSEVSKSDESRDGYLKPVRHLAIGRKPMILPEPPTRSAMPGGSDTKKGNGGSW